MKVRAHVYISGRVQGVSFRYYTAEQAEALGLAGWVRNVYSEKLPIRQAQAKKMKNAKLNEFTGVEVVLEGPKEKVEEMIKWCKNGSPSANVSDVEVEWESFDKAQGKEPERLEGFEIKR